MADRLCLKTHYAALIPKMPVRIDLQLHPAVAENPLGHHCDHVNTIDLRRNDERGGLVVGIGRARADRSHKRLTMADQCAIPVVAAFEKRYNRFAALDRAVEHHMGIEANQLALMIAVAVARSGTPGLDVTKHGASVASDRVVSHGHRRFFWP